jgi:hypothetical protein
MFPYYTTTRISSHSARLDSRAGMAHMSKMVETDVMTIRTRAIETIDAAFEETQPSGKLAILALELAHMTIVTRKLLDDVRYMAENSNGDVDINDLRIWLKPIKEELRKLLS